MEHRVFCVGVNGYNDQAAVDAAVEAVFAASPAASALPGGANVLVKPNLLARHVPEHAVTTHPAVLRAVLRALRRRGAGRIVVADSSGGLYNAAAMRGVYKTSGLAAVCEEEGVQTYADCRWAPRRCEGDLVREFNLIEPVHQADFIVNVPKIKTHVMTGMSCAVKNLFGTIPGLQKAELHMRFPDKNHFGRMLVDLCETVRPGLTVVDGIVGMEGDGPAGGTPRALGVVLGGEDPYTIDLAVCRMMGLAPSAVPYLAAAGARGLCGQSLDEALLAGDVQAAAPVAGFQLPKSYTSIDFSTRAPRALRWAVPGVEKWAAPRPHVRRAACIGCGKCAEICPGHTIRIENRKAHIDPAGCIRCFCCHEMCPAKAIDVRRLGLFNL